MNRYKVIFVKNEVISCAQILTHETEFEGEYYYEHDKANLIFAIIKAENPAAAIAKCDEIVKEVTNKVLGTDYVN